MTSTLKLAVVGVGALGRHHARILAGMEGIDLVAVADPDERQGRAVAEQHGTRWIADYHDLPEDLGGVTIAVPTSLHLDVAATFLNRHVPVMVEKPLAGSVEQAERISRLADRRGTLLQVGHVERFNPAIVAARPLVGTPKYVRAERVAPFTFRSTDIAVTHDLMIHDVDLVLELVGGAPLVRVEAMGLSVFGRHVDTARARLVFDGGCVADLVASRVNPTAGRTMQVWSTTGVVNVDMMTGDVVRYAPGAALRTGPNPLDLAAEPDADIADLQERVLGEFIEVTAGDTREADALTAELAEFATCIREAGEPTVNGDRALAAMRVVDAVNRAIDRHPWNGDVLGPRGPFVGWDDAQRAAA